MTTVNSPVDPDVKLPDAVRRAAARVEEIYNTPPQDPGAPEANQQASNEAGEGGEGASEPQQENSQGTDAQQRVSNVVEERTRQRRERARAASVAKADHVESRSEDGETRTQDRPADHQTDRQEETWERKFNAMKGRYEHANNQLQHLT